MGRVTLPAQRSGSDTQCMFIRSYIEVPGPFFEIEAALLREPGHWLTEAASGAEGWAVNLLGKVGFGPRRAPISREVVIEVGRPVRTPGKAILPIRWKAARAEQLFPVMEADLELIVLAPGLSQLALAGRYEPPLGSIGKLADRAFMHRVAEATVRNFVNRVAERLATVTSPVSLA